MGSVYVYESAKGEKLYRIIYRRPDNKQTQERGFKRKRDAEQRLAEVEVSKSRGDFINPTDSRVTVGDLGSVFLADREHVMKPSAYRPLESAWRVHVQKKWAARSLGSIRHSEVQTWVSGLAKDKSATTVLRAYGVLAAILDQAVKDRRLSRNPARDVKLPRKTKSTNRVYLSHAQVQQLAENSTHPMVVLTLAYTGIRWGEATGLRVRNLDLERRRLYIEENAVMVGGRIEVGTPKTHEARSVPFPEFLGAGLRAACEGKSAEALVFGDGVLHMRLPNSVNGWFQGSVNRLQGEHGRAVKDAEVRGVKLVTEPFPRVTPHDLRHTAASLAIAAGANVKAVQRMLGHASAAMTLDTYADLFDDDLDGVAVALDLARRQTSVANLLPRAQSQK